MNDHISTPQVHKDRGRAGAGPAESNVDFYYGGPISPNAAGVITLRVDELVGADAHAAPADAVITLRDVKNRVRARARLLAVWPLYARPQGTWAMTASLIRGRA